MKEIIYTDTDGFQSKRLIKNGDPPGNAAYGIPLGPPDLRQLDVQDILRQMNGSLVSNQLFTWDNVQRFPGGINVVVNVVRKAIIQLYREDYRDAKRSEK